MIEKAFDDYRQKKEPTEQAAATAAQQYQQVLKQVAMIGESLQQQAVQFEELKGVTERVVGEAKVKFAEGNQLSQKITDDAKAAFEDTRSKVQATEDKATQLIQQAEVLKQQVTDKFQEQDARFTSQQAEVAEALKQVTGSMSAEIQS